MSGELEKMHAAELILMVEAYRRMNRELTDALHSRNSELSALKKDARLVVGILKERVSRNSLFDDENEVIDRILAATEAENER